LSKQNNMAVKKAKKRGRNPKPPEERVKILQVYAKVKNHEAILTKFKPAIERYEKSLDKEVKQ